MVSRRGGLPIGVRSVRNLNPKGLQSYLRGGGGVGGGSKIKGPGPQKIIFLGTRSATKKGDFLAPEAPETLSVNVFCR